MAPVAPYFFFKLWLFFLAPFWRKMCSASSTRTIYTAVYVKWRRKKMRVMHVLASASPHRKFFDGKKWNCTAKSRYQQYTCKQIGCLNKCRTFCACSPGQWICRVCHPVHITCEVTSDSSSNWIQYLFFFIHLIFSEVGFPPIYLCHCVRSFCI